MNRVRAVGLVPHRDRPAAHALAREAATWFANRDVEVRLPAEEAEASGLTEYATESAAFAKGLDLTLVLGGDGTMLHAVQLVVRDSVPILGVNAGQLGYLEAIEPDELAEALPRLASGDYTINERMLLEVSLTHEDETRSELALNEVVLEKQQSGHLVRLDLSINGTPFTTYAADGVIVASPTGSTAYSFSVHGPIVSPALRCLILSPISAHMLFDRSLVLAEHEELDFIVGGTRHVVCTMDGRHIGVLVPGDRVRCQAAAEPLRFVELRPRDFHQILKAKFALPDR